MYNNFIKLSLICFFLFLCACSKQPHVSEADLGQDSIPISAKAENIWQSYVKSGASKINPFRTQMSLRYGTEGDTRRVTALLWGNNTQEIRLDVNAGIGVNIAKIYENKNIFIVFVPREEVGYYHQGEQKPLFNTGVPVPFNLQQLTQLIEGKFSNVFGTENNGSMRYTRDDNSDQLANIFTLNHNKFAGSLTLNHMGLPIFWQEVNPRGWSLSLSYRDGGTTPYKLTMIHELDGKKAILLIKNREYSLMPFTSQQMILILPDETPMLPLTQYREQL